MRRTVKRVSLKLNKAKFIQLQDLAFSYAKEKQSHLEYFQQDLNFANTPNFIHYQNLIVKAKYKSCYGLQARMFKLAAKDAFETELKYWALLCSQLRSRVSKLKWSSEQKHYAFWLLKVPQKFVTLVKGKSPINEKLDLSLDERKQVQNYLRRTIRKLAGNKPKVVLSRNVCFDAEMYDVEQTKGFQTIAVSSKVFRKKIKIPLKGNTEISGNIRLILFPEARTIEIHQTHELKELDNISNEVVGVDLGITEVFTDDTGNVYGQELNEHLKSNSKRLLVNGKRRSKLRSVLKKCLTKSNTRKVKNIEKYNLGKAKLNNKTRKAKETFKRITNTAINQLITERKAKTIVSEKLDFRSKAKSKEISRRVNLWQRSTLKERLEFKALVAGCNQEQVNPAYTSQTCSNCDYLDKSNRNGDWFHCLKCGQEMCSDWNAARNIKARLNDSEITVYTQKQKIKSILQSRYNARLESQNASSDRFRMTTVSGQTLDSVRGNQTNRQSKSETLESK